MSNDELVIPASQACVLTTVLQPAVKIKGSASVIKHRFLKAY
jgi:hypothetical protein